MYEGVCKDDFKKHLKVSWKMNMKSLNMNIFKGICKKNLMVDKEAQVNFD